MISLALLLAAMLNATAEPIELNPMIPKIECIDLVSDDEDDCIVIGEVVKETKPDEDNDITIIYEGPRLEAPTKSNTQTRKRQTPARTGQVPTSSTNVRARVRVKQEKKVAEVPTSVPSAMNSEPVGTMNEEVLPEQVAHLPTNSGESTVAGANSELNHGARTNEASTSEHAPIITIAHSDSASTNVTNIPPDPSSPRATSAAPASKPILNDQTENLPQSISSVSTPMETGEEMEQAAENQSSTFKPSNGKRKYHQTLKTNFASLTSAVAPSLGVVLKDKMAAADLLLFSSTVATTSNAPSTSGPPPTIDEKPSSSRRDDVDDENVEASPKRRCLRSRRKETKRDAKESGGAPDVDDEEGQAPSPIVKEEQALSPNAEQEEAPSPNVEEGQAPSPDVREEQDQSLGAEEGHAPPPDVQQEQAPSPDVKQEQAPSRHVGDSKIMPWFWSTRNPYDSTPRGIERTPYHVALPEEAYPDIISRLKIEKNKDFPNSVLVGSSIKRKGNREKYMEKIGPNPKVLSDAEIEEYRGEHRDDNYFDAKVREEALWDPKGLEEHQKKKQGDIEKKNKDIDELYIFVIWRQFEGRIPTELALQTLQNNQYNIPKALDRVDQLLKEIPQKMKTPTVSQVQMFDMMHKKEKCGLDIRWLQDNIMRNYHLSEVHDFFYKFRRYYGVDDHEYEKALPGGLTGKIGCNCRESKCRQLNFEPRYGCSNCTKSLRKNLLPSDKLCLICQTYTKITGRIRPARNVVFDKEDVEKIQLWDANCVGLDIKEFEAWHQQQKNKRYRNLELTQEDALSLNFSKLSLKKRGYSLGEQVCSMLQPYKLPHFSNCQCEKSGGIPNGTQNFGRTIFMEPEQKLFKKAILDNLGNTVNAARKLDVEPELVEVFLKVFKAGNPIWEDLPRRVKPHNYKPRSIVPAINPPPKIPAIGTVQKFPV